jgi:hypothetical protein
MNISVFVYYDAAFEKLAAHTLPQIGYYCARNGYALTIHRGSFGYPNRLPCFQKTELAGALLPGTDVLCVMDLDALITNHHIRLESFLISDRTLFGCEDVNGFNAGVYMVRNTPEGRDLMMFANAYGKLAPEGHGDQNAIRKWIEYNPSEYQKVPHPAFNSYLYGEYGETKTHEEGQWEEGDFILHLPGMTNDRRIEIIKEIQPKIIV